MTGFVCIENPPLDKALTDRLQDRKARRSDELFIYFRRDKHGWQSRGSDLFLL